MVNFMRPAAEEVSISRRYAPQIIATIIKNSVLFTYGVSIGMPTILIPNLSGKNSGESIVLDENGITWIASLNYLCVPLGCILSGSLSHRLGRKKCLIIFSIPFFIAFLLIHFANKPWFIFLALVLTGTCGGLTESPALSYASEISEPSLRGAIASTSTMFISLGVLLSFTLGTFLPWRTVSLINAIIPLISIFTLMLLPETPFWLLNRNRVEDAQKSLAWFRGWTTLDRVEKEFKEILDNMEKSSVNKGCNHRYYLEGRFIRPFFLILFAFTVCNFGVTPIAAYAVLIFNSLNVPISAYYATMITGCVNLLGVFLCTFFLRILGKRLLSFISLIGIFFCFFTVGVYCYLNNILHYIETTATSDTLTWVPLVSIVGVGFFNYLMINSLPWVLMGEIYYNEVRDAGTGLSAAVGYFVGFLANKTFLNLVDTLTMPGMFWFYSGVAAMGLLVFYFVLPETEGKTMAEIAQHYNGGEKLDNKVRRAKS
ncbi:facilitated trehalose transporter Tret1-like [Euwallacea similis]|uniref:facilitated trehalose transporter Tret1-like n=1 Tax=Euwallacea similis TaxID=1736056 RepID=UPI00344B4130